LLVVIDDALVATLSWTVLILVSNAEIDEALVATLSCTVLRLVSAAKVELE